MRYFDVLFVLNHQFFVTVARCPELRYGVHAVSTGAGTTRARSSAERWVSYTHILPAGFEPASPAQTASRVASSGVHPRTYGSETHFVSGFTLSKNKFFGVGGAGTVQIS